MRASRFSNTALFEASSSQAAVFFVASPSTQGASTFPESLPREEPFVDYRRLFVAALLSFGFLFLWEKFFPSAPPEPAPSETAAVRASAEAPTPSAARAVPALSAPLAPVEPLADTAERRIEIVTADATAILSNRGAELVSYVLKNHRLSKGGGLEMVRGRSEGPYPFGFVSATGGAHPLGQRLFVVTRTKDDGAERVKFVYRGPEGAIEKVFTFRPDGLFDVSVNGRSVEPWSVVVGPGLRNLSKEEYESRFERRTGVYYAAGSAEELDPKSEEEPVEVGATGAGWFGLDDQYFLAASVPRDGLEKATFAPVLLSLGEKGVSTTPLPKKDDLRPEQKKLARDFLLVLTPKADLLELSSYWGAKEYDRLASYPFRLEKGVRLGMFGFLALPLLKGLQWIFGNVVSNYGWAIVLMTILLKIVLLPLTHKSTLSMRKMQELNPKIQALRERWRPKLRDKQNRPNLEAQRKMNEEVMALYKTEGVNPAGGCLPLLLQMPIFFAFYQVLSMAVELRNAPWIGWIQDLSIRDPYYVLPLVMGATQVLQMRMTPMSGDPIQRRLFQLMPIFMTVLFLGFPSGLVLYWLTNNVLTIAQQAAYNRFAPMAPAEGSAAPSRRKEK